MAIGKTLRFEVFKRDGFACQYCGKRPPDTILEVDHIDPRANGGTDIEINLITSCFDCNRGKAARKLGDVHPRPDADLAYLEVQQEVAEAKRYLEASKIREQAVDIVRERLIEIWSEIFTSDECPTDSQWNHWVSHFGAEEVEYALKNTALRLGESVEAYKAVKYASGIMWRRDERKKAATDV
jgi:hypothetical protein